MSATYALEGAAVHERDGKSLSRAAPSDTLEVQVAGGMPFLTVLPDSVAGRPVESYRNLRVPALSLRDGRAFFWQTAEADRGRHALLFLALDRAGRADTLTLVVEVRR